MELARFGTAYFARRLNALEDRALGQASARAGWSRARVVASVALQAREIAQLVEAASGQRPEDWAETDLAALELAETLPPRALRHLFAHAAVHLEVVWRDLPADAWAETVQLSTGAVGIAQTPKLRAEVLWLGALDLANGARLRDLPKDLQAQGLPEH
ncbi:maleylpyruvate isomerase N-terminal domain-containing protein [Rhodobacter sp. JA431]|uniref:maleylpyruvate isomerase N-terminal domain-containing protein n=1 Tax=Rhodobacter sp. JA431 TaxID=570013 RepID=UPI000BE2DE61|nr:maleylpyruvate isomerase N-terminal domain-containing protein [Rhodobacter sp. JA431]